MEVKIAANGVPQEEEGSREVGKSYEGMPSIESYGPEFWARRRQLWLSGQLPEQRQPHLPSASSGHTNTSDSALVTGQAPIPIDTLETSSRDIPLSSSPAASNMAKLSEILAQPRAEEKDEVWNKGHVKVVWTMLNEGKMLKERMPLPLLIKVLRAGWIRDGTWPSTRTKTGRRALQAMDDDPFFDSPPLPAHDGGPAVAAAAAAAASQAPALQLDASSTEPDGKAAKLDRPAGP